MEDREWRMEDGEWREIGGDGSRQRSTRGRGGSHQFSVIPACRGSFWRAGVQSFVCWFRVGLHTNGTRRASGEELWSSPSCNRSLSVIPACRGSFPVYSPLAVEELRSAGLEPDSTPTGDEWRTPFCIQNFELPLHCPHAILPCLTPRNDAVRAADDLFARTIR
jgi:hypothetical protein